MDMWVPTFDEGSNPNVWMNFQLANYGVSVQHINHYISGNPALTDRKMLKNSPCIRI